MTDERYSGKNVYSGRNARDDQNRQREGSEAAERSAYWNTPREDESSRQELDLRRDRDRDDDRHYRGFYSRSHMPFRTPRGYGDVLFESWTLAGPYTGRGPKGYRRSDEQILEEACRRLDQDGAIDARDIEVTCESGVVRLQGEVENRRAKRLAEDCVESVYGVRDVMNELRVRPEPASGNGNQGTRQSGFGAESGSSREGRDTSATQERGNESERQGSSATRKSKSAERGA